MLIMNAPGFTFPCCKKTWKKLAQTNSFVVNHYEPLKNRPMIFSASVPIIVRNDNFIPWSSEESCYWCCLLQRRLFQMQELPTKVTNAPLFLQLHWVVSLFCWINCKTLNSPGITYVIQTPQWNSLCCGYQKPRGLWFITLRKHQCYVISCNDFGGLGGERSTGMQEAGGWSPYWDQFWHDLQIFVRVWVRYS